MVAVFRLEWMARRKINCLRSKFLIFIFYSDYNLIGLKNYYGLKIQIQNFVLVFFRRISASSCVARFLIMTFINLATHASNSAMPRTTWSQHAAAVLTAAWRDNHRGGTYCRGKEFLQDHSATRWRCGARAIHTTNRRYRHRAFLHRENPTVI